eukprot:Pompholyxophrys_punicea_v1_NODE_160_length_3071_cov_7.784151.p2 type:complete len:100 gc:universal NODE_160_length_3071_cov_7.784151:2586-2885(+)
MNCAGTTNDGNTARRFFTKSSEICEMAGLSKEVVDNLGFFIRAIACGFPLQIDKFRDFGFRVAKLCVDTYPWYPMPPSIHKGENLLFHLNREMSEKHER